MKKSAKATAASAKRQRSSVVTPRANGSPVADSRYACPKCGVSYPRGLAWHVRSCDGNPKPVLTPEQRRRRREARRRWRRVGPHSRYLKETTFDAGFAKTAEWKFIQDTERALIEQLGGNVTPAQLLLVQQIARMRLRLQLFDKKIAENKMTGLDSRVYSALLRQYRIYCRDVGLERKTAEPKTRSLDDITAEIVASR